MSIEHYRALIDQLCARLALPSIHSNFQSAGVNVAGVDFTLFHEGMAGRESVLLHCDFGVLPPQGREGILLRLLETQLHLFSVCAPVFAHDARSGHVLLMCRLPLQSDTGPDALLELLELFAGMARQWRNGHFLFGTAG